MSDATDRLKELRLRWALEDHPWLVGFLRGADRWVAPDGTIHFSGETSDVAVAEAGLTAFAKALGYEFEEVFGGYHSLQSSTSKDTVVGVHDAMATVTSKGQVTIPKEIRVALGIAEGDRVLFRVVDGVAVLARTPDLLDLAGAVPVPATARDLTWDDERERATAAQIERGR